MTAPTRSRGTTAPKRRGRPASANAEETRHQILESARRSFAERGYEQCTNQDVADKAGISTGAIYHYFGSKLDMYVAVYEDVQMVVYEQFEQAAEQAIGLVGKLERVFEAAHSMNRVDPTLAEFIGAARVDRRRHPELFASVHQTDRFAQGEFFDRIVSTGVATGEIEASDREQILSFLRTVTVGLADAMSNDISEHRDAIDGLNALLTHRLVKPPPATK
jgi:AcrR family transcriptional regulator